MSEGYRKTILLVEKQGNSTVSRNMSYKKDLEKLGYDVVMADTGEQAIQIAGSGADIDLVLMSVDLGDGMDGAQATKAILKKHELPIVFLVSDTETNIEEITEHIMCYGVISRNSSAALLNTSVKMAIKLHKVRMKEKARTEELQFQASILDHIGDYVTVTDPDGKIIYVNEAECKAVGKNKEEIIGKTTEVFGEDPGHGATQNEILEAIREKGSWRGEVVNIDSNNNRIVLDCRTWAMRDSTGAAHAFIGISSDITERKRMKEALLAAEQRLEKTTYELTENIPVGTYTMVQPPEGGMAKFEFMSSRFLELTGLVREEAASDTLKAFARCVHPDEFDNWVALNAKTFEEKKPFYGETRIIVHGEIRWVSAESNPRVLPDGSTVWEGVLIDITDRKRAEEALRESEEKLTRLVQNLHSGVVVHAPDTQILLANEQATTLLGLSLDQLMGKTAMDPAWKFIREDGSTLPFAEYPVNHVVNTLTPLVDKIAGIIRPKTNDLVWVQVAAYPEFDASGSLIQIVVTFVDITGRKQAEEVLLESEQRFRSIITVSNTGAWEYHRDKDYLWCSPEYFTMLGRDPDGYEMDGSANLAEAWIDLIHPDDRQRASAHFAEYLAGGSVGMYENYFRMKHKNGSWVWIWSRGQTLRDSEGKLTQKTVGTHIDITGRKLAEQALEKSLEEKNVLLSEIHHRVKNNMAVISSLLTLQSEFGEQKKDPEKLLKDLQTRILSMAWVHELVYESKDFAQIQSVKLLQRLVDYLKDSYCPDDKEILMQVRTEDIMLDMNNSVPLTLLIAEVLTNAWKHAFTGRRTGRIEVMLNKEKEGFRMIVRDDGVGVANLEKLRQPGSFGYTIIHGLAQQLRGELSFSSPAEGGLQVEAWFPDTMSTKVP